MNELLLERAIQTATSRTDDADEYWAAVAALQAGPPEEIWALVVPLAAHRGARLRALVPDVLRYLGGIDHPLMDRSVALFERMLADEQEPIVIEAIALAFVDFRHDAAIELLRPFAGHPSPRVREAVVHGVLPVAERVIPLLVELSQDEDDEVRDWATFGLGSQLGMPGDPEFVDTPEVRDALAARLDDPDDETRAEAVLGLALRGDARAVPVIERELARGTDWTHYDDAARLLKVRSS